MPFDHCPPPKGWDGLVLHEKLVGNLNTVNPQFVGSVGNKATVDGLVRVEEITGWCYCRHQCNQHLHKRHSLPNWLPLRPD